MSNINILSEVNKYFDDSSKTTEEYPIVVLITGIVGAGKTTIRRGKYKNGYVNIDVADIYNLAGGGELFELTSETEMKIVMIGDMIAKKAFAERRNIVTEIIGTSKDEIQALIEAIGSIGYKTTLIYVDCDPVEAFKRHINAVKTDKTYVSAHYCEPLHKQWILDAVKACNSHHKPRRNKVVEWSQLEKVGKDALQLTDHDGPINWVKQSWEALAAAGLTSYADEAARLKVISRFFALIGIYRDYFSIVMEESEYEPRLESWIDQLGVNPDDLKLMGDAALVDDIDYIDVLASASDSAREEVYQTLYKNHGGIGALFISLHRSLAPTDEECDVLNDLTSKNLTAYEWVEQGCAKYF